MIDCIFDPACRRSMLRERLARVIAAALSAIPPIRAAQAAARRAELLARLHVAMSQTVRRTGGAR